MYMYVQKLGKPHFFSGFWQGKSWHWKSGHGKGGKSEAREARKIWEGQRLWLLLFVGCVHVN